MISRLTGTLIVSELTDIVVDVNGVGYAVSVPMSTVDRLPAEGEHVTLLTQLSVREDAWTLYGFSTEQERALFRLVLSVSGIGPRIALNILSCMPVAVFCKTVMDADLKALSRINGIGKRSAERLVVDLRDKVSDIAPDAGFAADEAKGEWSSEANDAVAALQTLGYKSESARKAVKKILDTDQEATPSASELIRRALALLNS